MVTTIPRPVLDENHVYRVNGHIVPGCTTVIGEYTYVEPYDIYIHILSKAIIPGDIMRKASSFGTAIHKASFFILTGKRLDWNALNPKLVPTLKQLERWIERYKPTTKLCEVPLYSKQYHYCGTEDWFGMLGVKRFKHACLVDIKTGAYEMAHIQLSSYEQLIRENTGYKGIIDHYVLHLPKDGSDYQFVRVGDKRAFQYFLSKLFVYNYMRRTI